MKRLISAIIVVLWCIGVSAQFHDAPILPPDLNVGICIISAGDTTNIEPIKYYKQKLGSGAFLSGLTYGAAKVKNKNFYKGKTSPNTVKVGDTITFAFGPIPVQYISTLYMFQPQYTIRNFAVCKFEVKKDRRELTTASVNLWGGADVGIKESSELEFDVTMSADGIYHATITKAIHGEYCFVFTDHGVGAYSSVFDFSVVE